MKKSPFKDKKSLYEHFGIKADCLMCHEPYDSKNVVVLEEGGGRYFLHMKCEKCQSAAIYVVMITQFGTEAVGMMTDLSAEEAAWFLKKKKIDENDLLGFHKYIFSANNDFTKLILKK